MLVGTAGSLCPVAPSSPVKFHDHSPEKNTHSEESSGDEGITSYTYPRFLHIQEFYPTSCNKNISVNRRLLEVNSRLLEVARPLDINVYSTPPSLQSL